MTLVRPCTGNVVNTAGGINPPTLHGTQPVWETNDGATSGVDYPLPFFADGENPHASIGLASVAGPFTLSVRIAADWTGADLAWGYAELKGASTTLLARLEWIATPFDGFTTPGYVEVDYPMTLALSQDIVRDHLAGYDAPLTLTVQRQVGATPSGDGTYAFDVSYVALVITAGRPRLRTFPRDDRHGRPRRAIQNNVRAGWRGSYR